MSGDQISSSIGGDVHGQVAVGKNIQQTSVSAPLTPEERAELAGEFEALRRQVAAQAPAELQAGATERVTELEQALTAEKPDLTTVQYVKRWFATKLPTLAGSVAALLVHPLVGQLVQAGGDALVAEFADVTRD